MSIQHMENWAIYGGNVSLITNGVYGSRGDGITPLLLADPDSTVTGTVMSFSYGSNNSQNDGPRYVLSTTENTVGIAQRFWTTGLPNTNLSYPILQSFRDNGNNRLVDFAVNSTGGIMMINRVTGNIVSTTGPAIGANAWWHIEIKVTISSGTYEVRVEGVTVLSGTGENFGSLPCAQMCWGNQNAGAIFDGNQKYFKDVVFWDGSGTLNNDFLGSVVVYSLLPNADTTLGGWTLTGGSSGFSILDTTPPQDDVKYIGAAFPLPAASQFALGDLPANVTSIKAIMPMVRAKKLDGGDGNLQQSVVSGSATGAGANRPITAAYTYWRDVFETDPSTTAAWTVSGTNAVQLKLNRTV